MEICTMAINWREYKYYIICLIIGVIIGGCIGFNIGRYYYPRVETVVETKLTPGKEIVTEKTHTDIQYVPKTRYVDTKGDTVQEDTDVELNDAPEQVTVKVNGKETKFNTLSNETQKFENGKLQVDRSNQISFDIKTPDIPRVEKYINLKTNQDNKKSIELEGEVEKNGWKVEGSVDTSGGWVLKAGHSF